MCCNSRHGFFKIGQDSNEIKQDATNKENELAPASEKINEEQGQVRTIGFWSRTSSQDNKEPGKS